MPRSPNVTFDGSPIEYLTLPRSPIVKSPAPSSRTLARARTLACTACGLRSACTRPVPPTFPTARISRFVVVGEAPGEMEDRKGQVFVGRSGQILRRMMRDVGLDVDAGTWLNVNACRPVDNRTPEKVEIDACRGNLIGGLEAANSRYVLLCGANAVKAWRGDRGTVKVTRVHGRWGIWWSEGGGGGGAGSGGVGWWVLPTLHPAAILKRPALKPDIIADLEEFARVVGGGRADVMLTETCCECDGGIAHWEDDGIGWCEKCWVKRIKGTRRKKGRVIEGQGELRL